MQIWRNLTQKNEPGPDMSAKKQKTKEISYLL